MHVDEGAGIKRKKKRGHIEGFFECIINERAGTKRKKKKEVILKGFLNAC